MLNSEWSKWFAWYPIKTLGNERIWLRKIYRRERLFSARLEKRETVVEYATLLDVLSGKYDIKLENSFASVIIPMIRKVIPNMIASQLVSVQPMTGPMGEIFNVKPIYKPSFWRGCRSICRRILGRLVRLVSRNNR
jgi:hypothetical protein